MLQTKKPDLGVEGLDSAPSSVMNLLGGPGEVPF